MKIKTRDMILISLFAALTAIGAFLKIPTPLVPFTLQFVFCAYSGILLGAKYGAYSQILYVFIGLIGLPIFAKGGGPTYVLQPTFGYLIGFMVCSFIIGNFTQNLKKITFLRMLRSVLLGLTSVYFFGVTYLYFIVNVYMGNPMSIKGALLAGLVPYIASDLILSCIVSFTAIFIIPALRKSGAIKH